MKHLNADQLRLLNDFCDDNDIELRKTYSGRCMYGKTCIGFVTDMCLFTLGAYLINYIAEDDSLIDIFMDAAISQDSMGLSTIVYFPYISAELKETPQSDRTFDSTFYSPFLQNDTHSI